ncbi:MAG: hypothetical protein ABSE73_13250 [Planctomycetota bacterium]
MKDEASTAAPIPPGQEVHGPDVQVPPVAESPQAPPTALDNPAPVQPATLPGGFAPLWSVRDVAAYLQRSERWVYDALTQDPAKAGSIPFLRIPGGRGSHGEGTARFLPAAVQEWVASGCPPAAVFRTWQESERKKRKSA